MVFIFFLAFPIYKTFPICFDFNYLENKPGCRNPENKFMRKKPPANLIGINIRVKKIEDLVKQSF
jgi:hypothetical protein